MRRLRQSGLVAALTTLTALVACGRCGGAAGPPPERFVPADAKVAVVVPELRGAVRSLAEFYSTAENFPGTSDLPSLRASLSAQLGFDPFNLGALRDAGIDPRGGMAVFTSSHAWHGGFKLAPIVVLPVSNQAAAEGLVRRIATEQLGAPERRVEVVGPTPVAVYSPAGSTAPLLSVADGDGYIVLCPGPMGPEAVARAVSLGPSASLADDAAWRVARARAEPDAAAIAIIPAASPGLKDLWAIRDGVAIALSAKASRLRVELLVPLADREPSFLTLAPAAEEPGAGGRLAARLDPASVLVGRFDGDPAALGAKLLPLLPAPHRARLAKAGIDPQRDLFDALAPGAAASLSLPARVDLPGLDAQSLRRDPLRLAQFELVLPLRDPARAAALSERVARLAGPRPRGGGSSFTTASGEVAWSVDGDRLLVAGGAKGRLAVLRSRLGEAAGGYRAPTDSSRRVLADGGLGAIVLDTQNFVASVRGLPSEAFGSGPTGFVMRSLAERIVEPASRIDGVSLRASLEPGALVLAVEVEPRARTEGP